MRNSASLTDFSVGFEHDVLRYVAFRPTRVTYEAKTIEATADKLR